MKTKAAILVAPGEPLWIAEDLTVPMLATGQVLVKISHTGICGSQIMEINGNRGHDPWLPHMLGHEASGTVVDIGDGVRQVDSGDRVVLSWIKGQGLDVPGAQYKHNGKIVNSGPITTFSQYTIVSENRCTKISDDIPFDVAALLGCAVLTGFGAVSNFVGEVKGKSMAIFGLGGVGLSALMAAAYHKREPLIAVDVVQEKLVLARELGATHVVDARQHDAVDYIMKLTGGVSFSLDASGSTDVIESAFRCVHRQGGVCVFASHPPYGKKISLDPFDLICGKKIYGTWGGESKPDRDIPFLVDLYSQGKLPLNKLIAGIYCLEDINLAVTEMQNRPLGRILIKM